MLSPAQNALLDDINRHFALARDTLPHRGFLANVPVLLGCFDRLADAVDDFVSRLFARKLLVRVDRARASYCSAPAAFCVFYDNDRKDIEFIIKVSNNDAPGYVTMDTTVAAYAGTSKPLSREQLLDIIATRAQATL
jgi:hypothetical protein